MSCCMPPWLPGCPLDSSLSISHPFFFNNLSEATRDQCMYLSPALAHREGVGAVIFCLSQLREQGAAGASGLYRGHPIFVDARLCTLLESAEVLHTDSKCLPTCQPAWLLACRLLVFHCPRTFFLTTLPEALATTKCFVSKYIRRARVM